MKEEGGSGNEEARRRIERWKDWAAKLKEEGRTREERKEDKGRWKD